MSHERPLSEKLDEITNPALDEYKQFAQILDTAGKRMRNQTKFNRFSSALTSVTGIHTEDHYYRNNTYVTDKPELIPFPETIYHVTGGTVLNNFNNGGIILPSEMHFLADIQTDKGIMLHLVPAFMQQLGMRLSNLEQFVFSGSQIDAEQVCHINKLSNIDVETEGKRIFLQEDSFGNLQLNPDLETVLNSLDNHEVPFENDFLRQKVNSIIDQLYLIPNIREGWLDRIKNILYGIEKIKYPYSGNLVTSMFDRLSLEECMYRERPKAQPLPAVVLEINMKKLIQYTSIDGLFPFLISNRPVESIVTSIAIPKESVEKIYCNNDMFHPQGCISAPIESLDCIRKQDWLGGVNWRNFVPNVEFPLCATRYEIQTSTSWKKIAEAGLIAPACTIEQTAMDTNPLQLIETFGKENFKFTNSDSYLRYPKLVEDIVSQKIPFINGVFSRMDY